MVLYIQAPVNLCRPVYRFSCSRVSTSQLDKRTALPVCCYREGDTSDAAVIKLHWQDGIDLFKPVLYLLAVGVDTYDAPEINLYKGEKYLHYAGADAREFFKEMRQHAGSGKHSLYRELKARVLINKDATRENVLDGLGLD